MEHNILVDLQIAGQQISHFNAIKIIQSFNAHHEFEIVLNHDVIEDTGSFKIDQSQSWVGQQLLLSLDDGAMNFKGIICEVALEQSHGLRGNLIVKGYSSTILLEGSVHLRSYSNTTLNKVINEVMKGIASNDLEMNVTPFYRDDINYITQFKESNFQFLNRLSAEYGDFLYYDGSVLHFGKSRDQKRVKLVHGQNLNVMKIAVRVQPLNFAYFSYNSTENTLLASGNHAGEGTLNDYARLAADKSKELFSDTGNIAIKPRVNNQQQIESLTQRHAEASAANLADITGESTNTKVNIGSIAEIEVSRKNLKGIFDQNEFGQYLITEITHEIDGIGRYLNRFKGISADVNVLLNPTVKQPQAVSQVGTVTDNSDPKHMGRVKVQLLWQQLDQTTDWIRVLTPDAGSSGSFTQNRGQVFIPEVGDEVMVGFRYNDPDRPFVMGSLFNGDTAAGGGSANILKTISTRSGHLIEFDDSDGEESITITDKNRNVIRFDTNSSSIEITAPEYVRIRAKNIELIAEDDISFTAGESIALSAADHITQTAGKDLINTAENITMVANDNIHKTAAHIEKTAERVNVSSTKENIELHSSKEIINKSGGKVKLF